MELKDIKNINQRIYQLDTEISREKKVIFVAALIYILKQNKEFQNEDKLSEFINFNENAKTKPIDQLLELSRTEIKKLNLREKTQKAIFDSLDTISGVNTKLDSNRTAFKDFVSDFIGTFRSINTDDLFLETLYMEIDKKAKASDGGIVLTPNFAAELMIDLADIDYKKDVIADLCSGTGLFSLLSHSKMLENMNNDKKTGKITQDEYNKYSDRLYNSIIANDADPKMVTLCLANFLLKTLNPSLIYYENVLNLQKSSFKINKNNEEIKIQPTKAILNPPYEDSYKPLDILEKNIQLVKSDDSKGNRVVVIIPPQKFGQRKDVFSRILNVSTLESVIKMQDDLFVENGKSQPASIFVFNVDKPHSKDDIIGYYNFTDTGYIYLKDSGLVDKNKTFDAKKKELLERIKAEKQHISTENFKRTWTNFYEVNRDLEISTKIDPNKIKISKEEADITLENITIKKMLSEKQELVDSVKNNFIDKDGTFENYIVDILSED